MAEAKYIVKKRVVVPGAHYDKMTPDMAKRVGLLAPYFEFYRWGPWRTYRPFRKKEDAIEVCGKLRELAKKAVIDPETKLYKRESYSVWYKGKRIHG